MEILLLLSHFHKVRKEQIFLIQHLYINWNVELKPKKMKKCFFYWILCLSFIQKKLLPHTFNQNFQNISKYKMNFPMHKPNHIFQNNSKYISAFLSESLLQSKEIDTKCMWMSIWKNPWKQKDVHVSNYMKKQSLVIWNDRIKKMIFYFTVR